MMEAQPLLKLLSRVILRLLTSLSGGANINRRYARGMSPLHAAAQGGHLKVVKLLVKKGANIHLTSNLGAHDEEWNAGQRCVSDIIGLFQDLFGDPNGAGPSCVRGECRE